MLNKSKKVNFECVRRSESSKRSTVISKARMGGRYVAFMGLRSPG